MASSSNNPYGGGGIGGKIRRRSARPASTPYDRPPVAGRTNAGATLSIAGSSGWISKLVDPASRFLTGSASRLFSSVFQKRLPALENAPAPNSSAPEETIQEVEEEVEEELPPLITPVNVPPEIPAKNISDATRNNEQRNDRFTTRENSGPKFDVNSKLPEKNDTGPKRDDIGLNNSSSLQVVTISEIEQLLTQKTFTKEQFDYLTDLLRSRTVVELPVRNERENFAESSRKHVAFSTPASTVIVPKEEVASPMELAKAYMNSTKSSIKASPSSLRLRTPIYTERKPSPFLTDPTMMSARSSSSLALATRPNAAAPFSPIFDPNRDGYATPRSLGRTAISRMCRSPFFKGAGSFGSAYASKFSPYDTPTGSSSGGKQVLKRGSAALYDEVGTVGPIRRIRQKLNMSVPRKEPAPSPYKNFVRTNPNTVRKDTNQASTSTQKPLELSLPNNGGHYDERDTIEEMDDEEMKSDTFSFGQVPPRSTEMATRILDAVGKIVHDKSPSPNQEVKQIEAPSSKKEEKQKMDVSKGGRGEMKFSPTNNGVGIFGSSASAKGKAVMEAYSSVPSTQTSKPSFRMSVPEDLSDDDEEDTNANTRTETTIPVKNVFNKVESNTSEKKKEDAKTEPEQKVTDLKEKGQVSNSSPEPEKKKKPTLAPLVSESQNASGFSFTSNVQFDMPPPATPTLLSAPTDLPIKKDENTPPKATPPVPLFGFGLKDEKKSETSPFSWATPNPAPKVDNTIVSKPAATDASGSEKSGQKRKSEEAPKPLETSSPSPVSQPSTPEFSTPTFNFGGSASPNMSNGTHSSPPKFSFSASPAVTPTPEPVNPVSSQPATSTTTASVGLSSPAPEIPKVPSFLFGASSSAGSQTVQAPVPSDSGPKISEPSPVIPFAFGTGTITNTAGTTSSVASQNAGDSSSTATTGTATFGLFSSTPVASGTGTTGLETGKGTGTGTGGAPTFQFGSTGTVTFGASSQPAATSSSSQATFNFGATNPTSNSGTSVFQFGASTPNPSSSTTAPATFLFGAKPTQPEAQVPQPQSQSSASQFSSTFSSPAPFGAPSTGFSFTSNATSSTTPQTGLFGSGSAPAPSTSPSIFSTATFGTSSTTPSTSSFNFGQSSSAPGNSFAFGAQANPFSFSASNPNPSTGFGSSNPNPSTGFGMSSAGGNNDQMSMEDSMVDDNNAQAAIVPPAPLFGQPAPAFGQTTFAFGAQGSPAPPPNSFGTFTGNFSQGSAAHSDKAGRRNIRINRSKPRGRK